MTTTNTTIVASLPVLQGVVVEGGWDGCNFLFIVGMMGHWENHSHKSMLPLETPLWFAPIGGMIIEVNSPFQIQVHLECKQKSIL
jgi:hypothetical protein